jgi:hypothetical protein
MNPTASIPQDNERRTPARVVELARATLEHIDLDPASDEEANKLVRADRIYTKADNGLDQQWAGRVFLNPPGGKVSRVGMCHYPKPLSSAAVWWAKLLHEVDSGRVEAAIFVAFNIEAMLNTQKFTDRPIQAYPFCVPRKRLCFPSSCGEKVSSPPAASAVVLISDHRPLGVELRFRFRDLFSELGFVT